MQHYQQPEQHVQLNRHEQGEGAVTVDLFHSCVFFHKKANTI